MRMDRVKAGTPWALFAGCLLFFLQARADDERQPVTAPAAERPLMMPAMRAGSIRSGNAILISGNGVENISLERMPPQAVPKPKAPGNPVNACLDPCSACLVPQDKRGVTPGP